MELKLIEDKSDKLILFLTGWGCDDRQFIPLKTDGYNVLIAYDYSNLDFVFNFSKYNEIYLITFSAGVYVAGLLKDKLPYFKKKIAINGNPYAHDPYWGLSEEVTEQFKSVSKDNIFEFRRKYLVFSDKELELLNKYQPHRSLESCLNELSALESYFTQDYSPMTYDLAVLSDNDKIFRLDRQKEYFKDTKIQMVQNAGHFLFYKFESFKDLLFE